jgi:hypothetical protein
MAVTVGLCPMPTHDDGAVKHGAPASVVVYVGGRGWATRVVVPSRTAGTLFPTRPQKRVRMGHPATANAGVLRCAQDDGEKQTAAGTRPLPISSSWTWVGGDFSLIAFSAECNLLRGWLGAEVGGGISGANGRF